MCWIPQIVVSTSQMTIAAAASNIFVFIFVYVYYKVKIVQTGDCKYLELFLKNSKT